LIRFLGDCHSSQTRWPWCSHVALLSCVTTDDVNEKLRHMNFEDWEVLGGHKQANDRCVGIFEEINRKGMPPFSYRLVHERLWLNP
jgi:hypothetical protein